MERIQALIDKLAQQKNDAATPSQLLITVEMLRSELLQLQTKSGSLGTAKVAVTMPASRRFEEDRSAVEVVHPVQAAVIVEEPVVQQPAPAAKLEETPAAPREVFVEAKKEEKPAVPAVEAAPVASNPYTLRKPAFHEHSDYLPKQQDHTDYLPRPTETPAPRAAEKLNPAFNISDDAPTLMQHQSRKELHEVISEKRESLNDKLKQEKKELVHALKDSPIKDLRKAVGINDRFTFINELFRGDEAMYERSIKTINGYNIFSEAEYWMNRELKLKLGWHEDSEAVQHFYHLVRRRFS